MGKEFLTKDNVLIFEGQYENWKSNGEGKEYHINGKLKFVGEYINGKKISGSEYNNKGNLILIIDKNGKGKEYYYNDIIKFEGEYLYGKRWNGKGYDHNGNYKYEIKNGEGISKNMIIMVN